MPKIAEQMSDQRVRSHTFHFVTPGETDALKIPNACNVCHQDKSTEWATAGPEIIARPFSLAHVAVNDQNA